jgi:hypothetical protein
VRRLFNKVRAVIGDRTGAAHMHNTRGLGLANCLAALTTLRPRMQQAAIRGWLVAPSGQSGQSTDPR